MYFKEDYMRKKTLKLNVPDYFMETIEENAKGENMSVSDYINYLIYKENYLHFSALNKEKYLSKFYEKFNREKAERDVWSTLFNIN